jgi:hypothetical protein
LSTTHVLDAAVQTINALHRKGTPFDFGISLGDDGNGRHAAMADVRWPRPPHLAVSPTYKDFGTLGALQKATVLFTVGNAGTKGVADLIIQTLAISQSAQGQFAPVPGQDGCSGQTIKSGTSCSFQVSFAPTSAYTKLTTVTMPSNDPEGSANVPLTGVGR